MFIYFFSGDVCVSQYLINEKQERQKNILFMTTHVNTFFFLVNVEFLMQRKHLVVQDSLLDETVLTCGFNYNNNKKNST